jgi:hypothetical protein
MPLIFIEAAHVRVICDACRVATAEVCGRRDLPVMAKVAAMRKFRASGWHHDPGNAARPTTSEHAPRDGSGRWYCPECGRRSHL